MQKKNIWKKVTTNKIPKIGAKKLYKELIEKDIDALTREKSNSFKRQYFLNSRQCWCNIYC